MESLPLRDVEVRGIQKGEGKRSRQQKREEKGGMSGEEGDYSPFSAISYARVSHSNG